ncbi:MAG TPA: hypothetical protein PLE30_06540 [Candidatus Kapabacteria bacterium]|nr:hypothetical protein [Candidatus Kapabacteria bacterium]
MKYALLVVLATFLFSCNDNPTQQVNTEDDIKPVAGKLIISDATGKKIANNIKVDIAYNLQQSTNITNIPTFYTAPNPFTNRSSFEMESMDPVKVEISINDIANKIEKKIMSFNANAGFFSEEFDLTNFSTLSYPLLKAYLKFDGKLVDSTNLINLSPNNIQLLNTKNNIFIFSATSNNVGEVQDLSNYTTWFGERLYSITEETDIKSYYDVLPSLSFTIYNSDKTNSKIYTVNYSDIIEKGVVLKSF